MAILVGCWDTYRVIYVVFYLFAFIWFFFKQDFNWYLSKPYTRMRIDQGLL